MAKKKKIVKIIKLQINAGKATPAPPIGPALGGAGVNIMMFCKAFNDLTKDQVGDLLPVVITVFADKSFEFITRRPPVPQLIKKAIGIEKGSAVPNRDKVGKLTKSQALQIAKLKAQDMNARGLEEASLMVAGTARSMGIDLIEG